MKTRILFMVNNLYGGGAEKILQTLLKELASEKYDITLYGVKHEVLDQVIYPPNVTYKTLFKGSSNTSPAVQFFLKIWNTLLLFFYNNLPSHLFYRLFITGAYDVEVAFIEGYSTKIISGSHQNSIKVAWVHIDLEANPWTSIAYKNLAQEIKAYKKYDAIVGVSKSVTDAFTRKFGIEEKVCVKYNPINSKDVQLKAQQAINLEQKKEVRLVSIGRLEPQKGYDRLLEITNRLHDEGYLFELWIIGEGSQRPLLEKYIADHELSNTIKLWGFQSNPYPFLKASDIFVCSSRSEGYSTVVTEALVLGLPVVATNCSGMLELLGNSEYGLITENSTEDLYKGLKRMLDNTDVRNAFALKSKERSSYFDIKKTVTSIEELWES